MLHVFTLLQPCSMCHWDDVPKDEQPLPFASHEAARRWLQVYKHSADAMQVLREALRRFGGSTDVSRATDNQVIDELAALIFASRIAVWPLRENLPAQGGGGGTTPPGPQPPGPRPPPSPPPKPPRPPAPAPTPPAPVPPPVDPKGDLRVEVVDEKGQPLTEEVTITASGPQALSHKTKAGAHTFKQVALGVYSVTVTVPDALFDKTSDAQSSTPVPAGGTGQSKHAFTWLINRVTPKLELEYKVVLLDRKLWSHQADTETKILTHDVSCVEVSAKESTGTPRYTGDGSFEVSPAHVEVFTDAGCTTPLAGKIPNAQLMAGPVKLYLRAKAAGKFKAKLTLDPATRAQITVDPPAEEEMGVVELKLGLHAYLKADLDGLQVDPANDPPATYHGKLKALALPEQKALSDADKVKLGRVIHLQDGGHHDRAKLVLHKLDDAQWPAGTDDYEITLTAVGGLSLFDAQTEGTEAALPHKVKVKDLKAADLMFWVQGQAESEAARDAVIAAGLDRAAGGLAHAPKANGDWGRLTVVKISAVEFSASHSAGKPKVWDAAKARYYINTEAAEAGRTLGPKAGQRDVKVVAKLGKAIAGVPIHFMLAPDAGNAAPAGMPADWKPEAMKVAMRKQDCKDRKALMHFSAVTEANGEAKLETLVLSAFAGDQFTPAAYVEQDPHLAKYVPGHADLSLRAPTLCPTTLQVWKFFEYRLVYMQRHDGSSYSNRFTEADLQAKYESEFIEMGLKGTVVETPYEDFVPYATARDWVIGKLGAEEPRVIQLAFVDAIAKAAEIELPLALVGPPGLSFSWTLRGHCFDLSAAAKWLKSATCGPAGAQVAIPTARLTLANSGVDHQLSVDLTGLPQVAGMALADIAVSIVLIKHDVPSGLSWGAPTLVGMRWRESGYPGQEATATMRTAYHETGHYLGLAPKTLPDTAASASTLWYDSPGVGNHCKFGPQDCTMWHQFIMKINFCPTCKLALRARDHVSNVNAASPF